MNKKAMFTLIIKVVIAVAILFLIYAAFLKPEIYEDMWDSVTNLFSVPEKEPYPWEVNINSQRMQAIDAFKGMVRQFERTSQGSGEFTSMCFGSFSKLPEELFGDGKQFSVRIRTEAEGMSLQLFEFKTNTEEEGQQSTELWIPVMNKHIIPNYVPCVIYEYSAKNFYEEVLKKDKYVPEVSPGVPVSPDPIPLRTISFDPLKRFNYTVDGINLYEKNKIYFFIGSDTKNVNFEIGRNRESYYIFNYYSSNFPEERPNLCLIPTSNSNTCIFENNMISKGCLDDRVSTSLPKALSTRLSGAVCSGFNSADLK